MFDIVCPRGKAAKYWPTPDPDLAGTHGRDWKLHEINFGKGPTVLELTVLERVSPHCYICCSNVGKMSKYVFRKMSRHVEKDCNVSRTIYSRTIGPFPTNVSCKNHRNASVLLVKHPGRIRESSPELRSADLDFRCVLRLTRRPLTLAPWSSRTCTACRCPPVAACLSHPCCFAVVGFGASVACRRYGKSDRKLPGKFGEK